MMQTARNVFPTSIPAHRSTAAQIISVLPSGRRTADIFTYKFFPARLLHSGIRYVGLTSFNTGLTAPLCFSAAFSCLAIISHIFISGNEQDRSCPFLQQKRKILQWQR